MARYSYTIFLAKAPRTDFEAYLTENARNSIGTDRHQVISVHELGESSVLHVFRGSSGPPPWMRRLAQRIPEVQLENRQSVAACLFQKHSASIPFSVRHQLRKTWNHGSNGRKRVDFKYRSGSGHCGIRQASTPSFKLHFLHL